MKLETLPSVYEFADPRDFLNAFFSSQKKKNPRYSLRAWSRRIGFSSPALLSMILNGKRKLKPKQAVKLRKHLGINGEGEARYFDLLVLYSNSDGQEEREFYANILTSLKPDNNFSTIELDQFRLMADWHHIAILEMVNLADFRADKAWISRRLSNSVTMSQVEEAVKRLIRMGYLEEGDGILRRTTKRLSTPTDQPNESIRRFHSQMITKALEALEEQTVTERDITANTMTVSASSMMEAKRRITEFRRALAKSMQTLRGEEVYQLNIQFFRLTHNQEVS